MLDAPPNGAGLTDDKLAKRLNSVMRSCGILKSGGRDHVFVWPKEGPTLYKIGSVKYQTRL